MDFINITGYTYAALGVILAVISIYRYRKNIADKTRREISLVVMAMWTMTLIAAAGHMDIFLCIR